MVNFKDPTEIDRDLNYLMRFASLVDGLYIWEFFCTLDYEWSVICGRRPYRRTIWLYSVTRFSTLMAAIMSLIASNTMPFIHVNCQVLASFTWIFPDIAWAFASSLILVRIAAIWNMNRPAVALATGVWITNIAFLILGATRINSTWLPEQHACTPQNAESNKSAFIVTFATDVALILIMLVGLLQLRSGSEGWFELGRVLWKQGVIWLLVATIAELLPALFASLNLNVAFDMMFGMPAIIIMTIASTRMYRSLSDFGTHTEFITPGAEKFRRNRRSTRHANLAIKENARMEVAVHTTHEQYMTGQSTTSIGTEGDLRDKSHKPSLREDADSNV